MRGRRRHVSSVLADALASRARTQEATLALALADAIGPRLSREVTVRGKLRDGRLLVVVASDQWATQLRTLEPEILARLRERLGTAAPSALSVHVGAVEP